MKVKGTAKKGKVVVALPFLFLMGLYLCLSPRVSMPLYHILLFHPWKYPSGYYDDKAVGNLIPEDVWIPSRNGAKLHGWYYGVNGAKQTVIIHHGQGANLTVLRNWAKIFVDCSRNVLLYDYQGFGKSEGEPSIGALRDDGVAAFDFVCKQKGMPADRIVNCGESLGTGVAAYVTEKRTTAGLILFSPYASVCECAQQLYPILYVYPRLLLPDPELECRTCLSNVHPPVLIVHGTADSMIPVSHSDELFSIARDPKRYIRLAGAGHDPLNWNYHPVIEGFLNSLTTNADRQSDE